MTNVSILGCGWFGLAFGKSLTLNGVSVKGSVTQKEKFHFLESAGVKPYLVLLGASIPVYDEQFFDCDVILICIPPRSRSGEGGAYLEKISQVISIINEREIKKVVYISSTGVYGDHNTIVTESTPPEPDSVSGKILLDAERLFTTQLNFNTTIIRFAGLIGPGRDPGRFFAGKKEIPNGRAPVNLIHLDDCIGICRLVIEKDLFGALINASAPVHPTKGDFYRKASSLAGLQLPEFVDELKKWKMVTSQVIDSKLAYQFKVPHLIDG